MATKKASKKLQKSKKLQPTKPLTSGGGAGKIFTR